LRKSGRILARVRAGDQNPRARIFSSLRSGRSLVASALHQDIENDAGLVHGSPQPVPHTADLERKLTQMPFVPNLRPATTDLVRQQLAELVRTLPHGFVPDNNAASGQQLLHHA
jgi:hypothetical protein